MIGILSLNDNIIQELGKHFSIKNLYEMANFPEIDGLFIDWVDGKLMPKQFAFQALIIEQYVRKRIPVVVFDGNLVMTRKEFEWLKKFKVFFFEPAIKNRREFSYIPHWLSEPIKEIHKRRENRPYQLGYITYNLNNKIKSFEKYYRRMSQLHPNKKICYQTLQIDKDKELEYIRDNLIRLDDLNMEDVALTVMIDTQKNYEIGSIDPYLFHALHNGCLPLLPIEHKFFGNLFDKLVVSSVSELNFIVESFENIAYVIIDDIIDKIHNLFPEFLIENVALKIKECL